MIPLKLSMRNFMCYRDNVEPLSFEGIHLACLCGDNGSGKTAIFDAITWALWGRSRSNSDDDLIHLGQREMEVELEFLAGGNNYRVLRKRSKGMSTRPGHTILELQIRNVSGFNSLTGNSVRETENKINNILKLDYDTFIKSAYIRQGRADEFSGLRRDERKQVIANILGLDFYDRLEQKARDNVHNLDKEISGINSSIQNYQSEIAQKTVLDEKEKESSGKLSDKENELTPKLKQMEDTTIRKRDLETKKAELERAQQGENSLRQEILKWEKLACEYRNRIEQFGKVIEQKRDIEEGYQRLVMLRREQNEYSGKLIELSSLQKCHSELSQIIGKERASIETEIQHLKGRVAELQKKAEGLERNQEARKSANTFAEDNKGKQEALEIRRNILHETELKIQEYKTGVEQLKKQVEEDSEKLRLLEKETAECPLCGRELCQDDRHRIVQQYRVEIKLKSEDKIKLEGVIREKVRELEAERLEIKRLGSALQQEAGKLQREVAYLDKEIEQGNEAIVEIKKLRENLNSRQDLLNKGQFALSEKQELEEVEQKISDIGYNRVRHEQLRKELNQHERYDSRNQELQQAQKSLPEQEKSLKIAEEEISKDKAKFQEHETSINKLAKETAELPEVINEHGNLDETCKELQNMILNIRDQLIEIRTKLERIKNCEEKVQEENSRLEKKVLEKVISSELVEAFGRRGIQAILIDSAIPEIEQEANRLLSRMTSNLMSIKLDTQRESKSKKGELLETFDIKISDELGTRNYEMYSGGEAFRINFALRVALSRLLANRAGVPLPILFIDEGFGTQDSTGLHNLVECINSIKDDFEKIIVITHMEDLKNAFPVRIDVIKTPDGSRIIMQ